MAIHTFNIIICLELNADDISLNNCIQLLQWSRMIYDDKQWQQQQQQNAHDK